MKKLLIGFGALAIGVALAPGFLAFEAHVVNVTAKIENALQVTTNSIDFGTVFPQEHLKQPLGISLSGSFMAEDRVDDVEYFIRQKPKCAITSNGGLSFDPLNTATGHIQLGDNPATQEDIETYWIDCGLAPRILAVDDTATPLVNEAESWGVLPSLCEYISKEGPDANDSDTASFHTPWTVVQGDNASTTAVETSWINWTDTKGRLAKSEQDTDDAWVIDLAVPCFGGFCAQDWADFVAGINADADPNAYTQPIGNEHKIFGCDLWVEVSGVSEASIEVPPTPDP
ncbi:MAG: hypothetical protein AAB787_01045 [Patescibacteria group bacterium]